METAPEIKREPEAAPLRDVVPEVNSTPSWRRDVREEGGAPPPPPAASPSGPARAVARVARPMLAAHPNADPITAAGPW